MAGEARLPGAADAWSGHTGEPARMGRQTSTTDDTLEGILMPHQVTMPILGLTMEEGTITEWLKQPGDTVAKEEPLFVVETDKSAVEVVAPATGVLSQIIVQVGQTVPVRAPIAMIALPGEAVEAPASAAPARASGRPAPARPLRRSSCTARRPLPRPRRPSAAGRPPGRLAARPDGRPRARDRRGIGDGLWPRWPGRGAGRPSGCRRRAAGAGRRGAAGADRRLAAGAQAGRGARRRSGPDHRDRPGRPDHREGRHGVRRGARGGAAARRDAAASRGGAGDAAGRRRRDG